MSLNFSLGADVTEFQSTRRVVNRGAESLLGITQPVLDKGYVKLVDYLGCDESVVAAARTSFDKGFAWDEPERNAKLINYLMEHAHTSPFEQCALVFEIKAPIFVFREWHRHRTAKLNEMSGRYTELPTEIYVPPMERVQQQSKKDKQGSEGELPTEVRAEFLRRLIDCADASFDLYRDALDAGMAREIARIGLPLNLYSKMVWQMDLHNLLHFMTLRCGEGAQSEIRQYANVIAQIVAAAFPKVYAAYEEHVKYAVKFSKSEMKALRSLLLRLGSYAGNFPTENKWDEKEWAVIHKAGVTLG